MGPLNGLSVLCNYIFSPERSLIPNLACLKMLQGISNFHPLHLELDIAGVPLINKLDIIIFLSIFMESVALFTVTWPQVSSPVWAYVLVAPSDPSGTTSSRHFHLLDVTLCSLWCSRR